MSTVVIDREIQAFREQFLLVRDEIARVIVGNEEIIAGVMTCLLARGHVLLEGIPGVGKTKLVQTMADVLHLKFSRIQFTPDLMPGDIIGTNIVREDDAGRKSFEFQRGPIFANMVLADEINRATPKTQAALLEAMEEKQVTVDGVTHMLPAPFMVLATQNPIEYEGTFPLPEAQLDRFILRLSLGYPTAANEIDVLDRQQFRHPIELLEQVIGADELLAAQAAVRQVYADPAIKAYLVEIVTQTRKHPDVYLGASPRGSLALHHTAQARAALHGRDYVIPDDIKTLAEAALAHRIIIGPAARIKDISARSVIQDILSSVPVPGGSLLRRS